MEINQLPDNPYLLLTPGPLSTSKTVKATMLRDWCTWDDDYKNLVEEVRTRLVRLATRKIQEYTTILMQGSGTFSVEAMIGTAVPESGKLLVLTNGAYGDRIAQIAAYYKIRTAVHNSGELNPPDLEKLEKTLTGDPEITHVVVVHCETTTGMLNPIEAVGRIAKKYGKIYLVDTMSSFGGIPMDIADLDIDFCVSSANKCIQGVPGFCFVVARTAELAKCEGRARSLSLDLFDQWKAMDKDKGKWRYTSPTHVVRAFYQAMRELEEEGGIESRHKRYSENHRILVAGMRGLGFQTLLPDAYQSPIITSFYSPASDRYDFVTFYDKIKSKGFVIYPGKVSEISAFRIGNIGHVFPDDMHRLIGAVQTSRFWEE